MLNWTYLAKKTELPKISDILTKLAAITIFNRDKWNSADLRYFDLHFNKLYSNDDIIMVNKKTWIQDVDLFVDQVKNLIQLEKA